MSEEIEKFILESAKKSVRDQKSFLMFGTIDVHILNKLPEDVDIVNVINVIESIIPKDLVTGIDVVYIGYFKEFEEKNVNAMYKDGAIYISHEQDDEDDLIDDFVHEIAHAVEDLHTHYIYSDGKIQNEFLGKRKRLKDLLEQFGYLDDHDIDFSTLDYSKDLDDYLYQTLGYDKLETFCNGLFLRPYAVTGLREYFATAFEDFLLEDAAYVKNISPMAFKKVYRICIGEV